jgi:4-alpha-glucanotransferase
VQYERIAEVKAFFLALLYRQFRRTQNLTGYRAKRGDWLESYCTYKAFDRYFHRRDPDVWHWHQWHEEYRSPASPASQALRKKLHRQIDFYAYIEMCIDQQVGHAHQQLRDNGYSVGLYQDLALATDRVGADYWAYQDLFAPRVRVGSPPDDFNENGQDWGFPALHPQRHCDSGYRYFIESIRCAAEHAGAIRLDHVMRLARLYWIPDNMSARDGAYVRDRFEDLLGILALESQRGNFIVVGEDLGTVPDYFRRALDDMGILSYRLILFERDGARFRAAEHYPAQAIASFTTHDLPTFDGWLQGTDLEARVATGQLPQAELEQSMQSRIQTIAELRTAFQMTTKHESVETYFAGLCAFLAATPSQLRLINLEELTAETEQQNMPGTTSEAPNWQRKLKLTLDELSDSPQFRARIRVWNHAIQSRRPQ